MDLFEGYDWTKLHIVRAVPVTAKASERRQYDHVNAHEYQLGVKFHGRTEINFADKQLVFDTGTVLYLPICADPDTPYNKIIRENGTGGLDDLGHGHHMVIVAVGQQDHFHLISQLSHCFQNLVGLLAGVDDSAGFGLLVTQNETVGAEPTHDNRLDDHIHTLLFII